MLDSHFLTVEASSPGSIAASLVERAISLSWTRDPFDRLLAAHIEVRRSPMISVDEEILDNHRLIVRKLKT